MSARWSGCETYEFYWEDGQNLGEKLPHQEPKRVPLPQHWVLETGHFNWRYPPAGLRKWVFQNGRLLAILPPCQAAVRLGHGFDLCDHLQLLQLQGQLPHPPKDRKQTHRDYLLLNHPQVSRLQRPRYGERHWSLHDPNPQQGLYCRAVHGAALLADPCSSRIRNIQLRLRNISVVFHSLKGTFQLPSFGSASSTSTFFPNSEVIGKLKFSRQ